MQMCIKMLSLMMPQLGSRGWYVIQPSHPGMWSTSYRWGPRDRKKFWYQFLPPPLRWACLGKLLKIAIKMDIASSGWKINQSNVQETTWLLSGDLKKNNNKRNEFPEINFSKNLKNSVSHPLLLTVLNCLTFPVYFSLTQSACLSFANY